MPEDGIVIWFDEIQDVRMRPLAEQLAEEIVQRSIMEYFTPDARHPAPAEKTPHSDWDDLVPPDISDGFDFLL
ncbi:MAG: hypothetical protein ACE369_03755 [Roseovarius sp.]